MQNNISNRDFTTVTETPENGASQEQLARLYTRYRFASEYCIGKDVLEVACGTGIGIGYLAGVAKQVVTGDIDEKNFQFALRYYSGRKNIKIQLLDAHNLPFNDESFDVVILYEAIYYLFEPHKFIAESRRVLKDSGILIICSANKEWAGFNPSPYSHKYFAASELFSMLNSRGFKTELFADCPAKKGSLISKFISVIKVLAVKLHLMPKTMKGKEFLKRIFHGKLTPLPAEITEGMSEYTPPIPIPHDRLVREYKVIFAVAQKTFDQGST